MRKVLSVLNRKSGMLMKQLKKKKAQFTVFLD